MRSARPPPLRRLISRRSWRCAAAAAEDIDLFVQPSPRRRRAQCPDHPGQHGQLDRPFADEIDALVSSIENLP